VRCHSAGGWAHPLSQALSRQSAGWIENYIALLNADGSLVDAFNPNPAATVLTLAAQPDGKILIGGWFTKIGTVDRCISPGLTRWHPRHRFPPPAPKATVRPLWFQPDGKDHVGGGFNQLNGVDRNHIGGSMPTHPRRLIQS